MHKLRLVCRFLNEAASPRALKCVRLGYGKFNARAKALLDLGDSAFGTYTTSLTLSPETEATKEEDEYECTYNLPPPPPMA